ncbi:hypothetical protein BLNAU_24312 [Blattamonas nauphoetae]|uniref:Uncharacterized protein n=1 Tax=Blattamonas nauphoetae TaxID=2049346 RepID=A0ABQ9WMU0_9EUKA|nr:hypothetical protein BLNAU_24312 [Blattamonas nauphoetae]
MRGLSLVKWGLPLAKMGSAPSFYRKKSGIRFSSTLNGVEECEQTGCCVAYTGERTVRHGVGCILD